MKKITTALFMLSILILPVCAAVQAEPAAGMVEMQQCPKCHFASADKCPMCGTQMEKKTMTTSQAQSALDQSSAMLRKR